MEEVAADVLHEALEASARIKQDPAKPPEPNNGQQTEGSVASAATIATANTQGEAGRLGDVNAAASSEPGGRRADASSHKNDAAVGMCEAAALQQQQLEGTGGGAPWFEYTMTSIRCALRKQGRLQVQAIRGQQPIRFSVHPPLPAGMSLEPTTGTIHGRPTKACKETQHRILAVNQHGEMACNISLQIVEPPGFLRYAAHDICCEGEEANHRYCVQEIPLLACDGDRPLYFSMIPSVSNVRIDPLTGNIAINTSISLARTVFTITTRNLLGEASVHLVIEVKKRDGSRARCKIRDQVLKGVERGVPWRNVAWLRPVREKAADPQDLKNAAPLMGRHKSSRGSGRKEKEGGGGAAGGKHAQMMQTNEHCPYSSSSPASPSARTEDAARFDGQEEAEENGVHGGSRGSDVDSDESAVHLLLSLANRDQGGGGRGGADQSDGALGWKEVEEQEEWKLCDGEAWEEGDLLIEEADAPQLLHSSDDQEFCTDDSCEHDDDGSSSECNESHDENAARTRKNEQQEMKQEIRILDRIRDKHRLPSACPPPPPSSPQPDAPSSLVRASLPRATTFEPIQQCKDQNMQAEISAEGEDEEERQVRVSRLEVPEEGEVSGEREGVTEVLAPQQEAGTAEVFYEDISQFLTAWTCNFPATEMGKRRRPRSGSKCSSTPAPEQAADSEGLWFAQTQSTHKASTSSFTTQKRARLQRLPMIAAPDVALDEYAEQSRQALGEMIRQQAELEAARQAEEDARKAVRAERKQRKLAEKLARLKKQRAMRQRAKDNRLLRAQQLKDAFFGTSRQAKSVQSSYMDEKDTSVMSDYYQASRDSQEPQGRMSDQDDDADIMAASSSLIAFGGAMRAHKSHGTSLAYRKGFALSRGSDKER